MYQNERGRWDNFLRIEEWRYRSERDREWKETESRGIRGERKGQAEG